VRAPALTLLLALTLAACGSTPLPAGPEATLRTAITTALTNSDPSLCTLRFTRRFIEQTHATKGREALRQCRRALRDGRPAEAAVISQLTITGERARAQVAIQGGDQDGATLGLRLVHRFSTWKLDRITSVELEFERFLTATEHALQRRPLELPLKEAHCVAGRLRKFGERRVERSIVKDDPAMTRSATRKCLGSLIVRRQFDAGIKAGLAGQVDEECVITRVHRTVSVRDIRAVVAATVAGRAPPQRVRSAISRAVIACASGGDGRFANGS
jgi:hypothetical protein